MSLPKLEVNRTTEDDVDFVRDTGHAAGGKPARSETATMAATGAAMAPLAKKRRMSHVGSRTGVSSRGVANLTPEQLAKKRANDREAQRAIRERTKVQIETLEARVSELTAQKPYQELQEVLRQKKEIEAELTEVKRLLAERQRMPHVGSIIKTEQLDSDLGMGNGVRGAVEAASNISATSMSHNPNGSKTADWPTQSQYRPSSQHDLSRYSQTPFVHLHQQMTTPSSTGATSQSPSSVFSHPPTSHATSSTSSSSLGPARQYGVLQPAGAAAVDSHHYSYTLNRSMSNDSAIPSYFQTQPTALPLPNIPSPATGSTSSYIPLQSLAGVHSREPGVSSRFINTALSRPTSDHAIQPNVPLVSSSTAGSHTSMSNSGDKLDLDFVLQQPELRNKSDLGATRSLSLHVPNATHHTKVLPQLASFATSYRPSTIEARVPTQDQAASLASNGTGPSSIRPLPGTVTTSMAAAQVTSPIDERTQVVPGRNPSHSSQCISPSTILPMDTLIPIPPSPYGALPACAVPPRNIPSTGPLDSLLLDYLADQRHKAIEGTPIHELIGPPFPSFGVLLPSSDPSRDREAHSLSRVMTNMVAAFPSISRLPEQVAVVYVMFLVMRWQICPNQENYDRLPDYITPRVSQIYHPHPLWLDHLPFPLMRDKLVHIYDQTPLDDFFVPYTTTLSLNWPYGDESVLCRASSRKTQTSHDTKSYDVGTGVSGLTSTSISSSSSSSSIHPPASTSSSSRDTFPEKKIPNHMPPTAHAQFNDDDDLVISPAFEVHMRQHHNWTLGHAFGQAHPTLKDMANIR